MEYVKSVYPCLFLGSSYPENLLFERSFIPLKVDGCNAYGPWSFSDATVDVSSASRGEPQAFIFRGAIQKMLKSRTLKNTYTSDQKEAFESLGSYLRNESHRKCLQALQKKKPQGNKEGEIQAVLALHLFSPLVAKPEFLAAQTCDEKCCSCGKEVNKGDTSFGNSKVWHGNADILVRHSKVKVVKHVPEDIDEEGSGEPLFKKIRKDSEGSICQSDDNEGDGSFTSVAKVKTACRGHYMPNGPLQFKTGVHCKDLSQVLAQTIVNAFIQNKKFPDLKEYFIPCFLASENFITVHMYNPHHDILLSQGESMPIFSEGKLDIDTIFTVWLALNFDKFPAGMLDENIKKSGFHSAIFSCIDVYRNEMVEPMICIEPPAYQIIFNKSDRIVFLKKMWENEVSG